MGGTIVSAYPNDAMYYRADDVTAEEIENSIKNKKGRFNEINVDTRESDILPYFDLYCLMRRLNYGINTFYGWNNSQTHLLVIYLGMNY